MNKSGTYTWFGYVSPFEERLRAIKDAGFDNICTFWTKEMEEIDGPRISQPERAQAAGLYLEHTHLSYFECNAMWNNDLKAQEMLKGYIEDIKLAHKAKVSTVVMHPCEVYVPNMSHYPLFYANMKQIADVCGELKVRLAIENLGENVAVRKIIDDLSDNPFVGLCFDSGHNNIVNHNDFSLLRDYSDRIFATHIHDNNGTKDQHILPYSDGCTVDWKIFLDEINRSGFSGSLMLEATYPFDYESLDSETEADIPAPTLPMQEWLKKAKNACDKIYSKK